MRTPTLTLAIIGLIGVVVVVGAVLKDPAGPLPVAIAVLAAVGMALCCLTAVRAARLRRAVARHHPEAVFVSVRPSPAALAALRRREESAPGSVAVLSVDPRQVCLWASPADPVLSLARDAVTIEVGTTPFGVRQPAALVLTVEEQAIPLLVLSGGAPWHSPAATRRALARIERAA